MVFTVDAFLYLSQNWFSRKKKNHYLRVVSTMGQATRIDYYSKTANWKGFNKQLELKL